MLFLVVITVLNQMMTRKPEAEATTATLQGDAFAETDPPAGRDDPGARHARGGHRPLAAAAQPRRCAPQLASGDRVSQFSTISKTFRFFLQSAMLGLGAYWCCGARCRPAR